MHRAYIMRDFVCQHHQLLLQFIMWKSCVRACNKFTRYWNGLIDLASSGLLPCVYTHFFSIILILELFARSFIRLASVKMSTPLHWSYSVHIAYRRMTWLNYSSKVLPLGFSKFSLANIINVISITIITIRLTHFDIDVIIYVLCMRFRERRLNSLYAKYLKYFNYKFVQPLLKQF